MRSLYMFFNLLVAAYLLFPGALMGVLPVNGLWLRYGLAFGLVLIVLATHKHKIRL